MPGASLFGRDLGLCLSVYACLCGKYRHNGRSNAARRRQRQRAYLHDLRYAYARAIFSDPSGATASISTV